MATLLLTAVGTAIGGPVGGSIGAIIGQQADRAIFGGGTREGPRLKELSVTTSSYGQPMPRQFGRMRVAGTIIWSTELIESSSKEGGGKGQPSTRVYSYSASFAVALSSTPIERVGRIWADGNLLRGVNEDLKVEGEMRVYPGTGDSAVDPTIAADRGSLVPAFRDCAYVVFEGLQLAEFGNRIPALTFEVFASQDPSVSLAELVPESVRNSANATLRNAHGFADEGGAIGASLSAIDRVFPLTCVTTAEGLSLASRNEVPDEVPELPRQLSAIDSEDAVERNLRRGERLGTEPLALRYYDEERDYQPSVQRALGPKPAGREAIVDLPATMTAEGARQLANSNAQRLRWGDETIVWRIGELDPHIGPGSIVRVPGHNGHWLVRSWEWFDRGIELNLERIAPDVDSRIASDAGAANAPSDLTSAPTLLEVFEVPADDTSNLSSPMLFAAASSVEEGWRGAALFVEKNGTLASIGSTGARRAIVGTLAVPLEASSCALFEASSSIEFYLPAKGLALDSTDISGLAMGENRLMVGTEVIQFLVAEHTGDQRWRLSGLLRGRGGTEDAASAGHSAGASVVMLDDRLTSLDASAVPAIEGTRIAAVGRGDLSPVYAILSNAGLSRRPLMPIAARSATDSQGHLRLCWTRRARGQWRWYDGTDVPLVEEREAYTVGFGPSNYPHAIWSTVEPELTISATDYADLLATFGSGPLWVRQDGTFGQSSPLFLTTIN